MRVYKESKARLDKELSSMAEKTSCLRRCGIQDQYQDLFTLWDSLKTMNVMDPTGGVLKSYMERMDKLMLHARMYTEAVVGWKRSTWEFECQKLNRIKYGELDGDPFKEDIVLEVGERRKTNSPKRGERWRTKQAIRPTASNGW